eukprot:COSAG01_NODE_2014_length_8644_cov_70.285079_8_plen_56_part_00
MALEGVVVSLVAEDAEAVAEHAEVVAEDAEDVAVSPADQCWRARIALQTPPAVFA